MKKLTKRKAFNFLRSYFDVLNEIPKKEDKLEYLLALINKQFLDEEPEGLNFIVNLCYESQRHQIEESVKGWERATNQTLKDTPPTPLGTTPPTPLQEEKEEEKEKEKEVYMSFNHLSITKAECIKLNENYTKKQIDTILEAIQNYKPNKKYTSLYLTAKNWLKKEYGENGREAKEVDPLVEHVKKMTGK
jgi:hypothetical protein